MNDYTEQKQKANFKEKNLDSEEIKTDIPLRVVVAGHVDDGKSTLIGRILYETDSLPEGKLKELQEACKKRAMDFEWSFVLDAFQAERDQGITIDTTRVLVKNFDFPLYFIDVPGHVDFIKNMISGASEADAAILIIDASYGIREQTYRHSLLLNALGVKKIIVVVNKMDLVGYKESTFMNIASTVNNYLLNLNIKPEYIIAMSAKYGYMVSERNENLDWYQGSTLVDALKTFGNSKVKSDKPFRFCVQDIYKFDDERILAGKIESGNLKKGDDIIFSPSNKVAKVTSIKRWNSTKDNTVAKEGECIGITLDKQIYNERGDLATHVGNLLPTLTNVFFIKLFWLNSVPLKVGNKYELQLLTKTFTGIVQSIEYETDLKTLKNKPSEMLQKNKFGKVVFRSKEIIAVDEYDDLLKMGRCVIKEDMRIVGGGIISVKGYPNLRYRLGNVKLNTFSVDHKISNEERAKLNGHKSGVFWFTGLSASGKSTLAMNLEKLLFEKGYQVYVLDGDNIRGGINSDLKFSPNDRSENLRRLSEISKLFADQGCVCIAASISPYVTDREFAKKVVGDNFYEIFIKADLKSCENRDPKGLYKKARAGILKDFSGISAPYEEPVDPHLIIDTDEFSIEENLDILLKFAIDNFSLKNFSFNLDEKENYAK